MTNLLLLALLACGGTPATTSTPEPADPSAGPDGAPAPAAPDTDAPTNELPTRVPEGATELPAALVCPDDNPGPYGCFREIPGGTLRLGAQAADPAAPAFDPAARPDEGPVADVAVTGFWIQRNEVIASHVAVCVREGGCSADDVLSGDGGNVGVRGEGVLPAVGVSWKAADDYCRWLGGRLPTEAEYEWVTRGAEGRRFTWGDRVRCNLAGRSTPSDEGAGSADVVCRPVIETLMKRLGEASFGEIGAAIGRLPPGQVAAACRTMAALPPVEMEAAARRLAAGSAPPAPAASPDEERCPSDRPMRSSAMDDSHPQRIDALTGNVREWVADAYVPRGGPALDGARRLTKGGSYLSEDDELRAAARDPLPPEARLPDVGFRCAWSRP